LSGFAGEKGIVTASNGASELRTPAGPAVAAVPEQRHQPWPADPETLLLVEDDPADALLVEELLADSGMRATLSLARSLAEAKELLKIRGMPGCILLDLHRPDARGLEAVTQVLAAAPPTFRC
jgi:response regulator RpfG family c-di-GMP phosphodiesterase